MPVNASLSFARGLKSTFIDTYKRNNAKLNPSLSAVMDMGQASDGAAEDFFYYLSAPHPVRTAKGASTPRAAFGGRRFRALNYNYKVAIEWHEDDEADDQTGGLVDQARSAAGNFTLLPERVFFQILQGTTDTDLLPSIPNAGDGAALYSTTNGSGTARFGATGGNSLTGLDLTTAADWQSSFYQGVEQFDQFEDTEGQPLDLGSRAHANGITLVFNSDNRELAAKAFRQSQNVAIIQNAGGTENVAAAAQSNFIIDSGLTVDLFPSPRVTDSKLRLFIRNFGEKAIFMQTREALKDNLQDRATSDITKDNGMKALFWKWRGGFSPCGEPFMTVQVAT